MTHDAMYVTDFGRKRVSGTFDRQVLARSLDHSLAWALGRADWDLAGELSMAAWYCRDVSTSWQSSCDDALDAVFERFGFVPAPTFDTNYANALTSTDRDRYSRFHAYHTTIVYALLLLARHGRQRVSAVDPAQDLCDLTPIWQRHLILASASHLGEPV